MSPVELIGVLLLAFAAGILATVFTILILRRRRGLDRSPFDASGFNDNLSSLGAPSQAETETTERSWMTIHGLIIGLTENVERLLEEVTQYDNTLAVHEASLRKAKTLETLHAVERLMQEEVERMRNATSEYQHRLDQANAVIETQQAELDKLNTDALIDSLTRIPNRRCFDKRIGEELSRFRRHGQTFSLALLDIDHFKNVNDQYGHVVGDRVLRAISGVLSSDLRKSDFAGRYGGEEFVMILPETDWQEAIFVVNKIRHKIEKARFRYEQLNIAVTLSAGITQVSPDDTEAVSIIARADSAMYRAKEIGRNQVCANQPDGSPAATE
jgi:diguanylate cyclase (GGDEF)-like protein